MKGIQAPVILLSRLSSSRLPGKALIVINGTPIIGHIIKRLNYNLGENWGMVATSVELSDDPLAFYVSSLGVDCFRGSLNNVAERFMKAALTKGNEYVVRITGDSLFIDTAIIEEFVEVALNTSADLVSNRKYPTYPVGQTVEVVKVSTFVKEYPKFNKPGHFEHVTQYFYEEDPEYVNIIHIKNPNGIHRNLSMAVDTAIDLEIAERIINRLGDKVYELDYISIENEYKRILLG